MVTTRPPKTIVKPAALGPVANTDTKLLIYGLFQKGRVLAQDGVGVRLRSSTPTIPRGSYRTRSLHGDPNRTKAPIFFTDLYSGLWAVRLLSREVFESKNNEDAMKPGAAQ